MLELGYGFRQDTVSFRTVEFCCRIIACSWTTPAHPGRGFCNFLTHFLAHSRHQFEHTLFRIPSSAHLPFRKPKYLARATRSSTTSAIIFKHHVSSEVSQFILGMFNILFFAVSRITLHFQEQFAVSIWVLSPVSLRHHLVFKPKYFPVKMVTLTPKTK